MLKPGQHVRVRDDDDEEWFDAIFVCYVEGEDYPYHTVLQDHEDFWPNFNYMTEKWMECIPA